MALEINEPWITSKVRCQNGYAYIDTAHWDKDKQQSAHKRVYIGKYDGTTFTPNKNYFRLRDEYEQGLKAPKTGPVPTDICVRQFYGATYLLDEICQKTGIAADLGKCFGCYQWLITLFLKKARPCIVSINGVRAINIHLERTYHLNVVVSYLV